MMHIKSLKHQTKREPIVALASPTELYLPLKAYKGEMQPVVQIGQPVKKYELVAKSDGLFATSIHAPVSGKIVSVETIDGENFLKLKNDFREDEIAFDTSRRPEQLTPTEILDRLEQFGIEGSGGARFPTHTKYGIGSKTIETFIVNAAECEPYLTADYALISEHCDQLFKAISIVYKLVPFQKIVFAIEKQHKELAEVIRNRSCESGNFVSVKLLPNEYPQGGELQLIKSVTGKELPKGSIPANYGVIVNNVGTLWAIYRAIFENRPYTERVITFSGEKASTRGNYLVKIGTPVHFVLQALGEDWNPDEKTIILGGPMMGKAVHDPNVPINKGSGGLLLLETPESNSENCIKCGYCVDVCPQKLMPMEFARTESRTKQKLVSLNLNDCIECGACAYVCPSDVPLLPGIFAGKKLLSAS